MLRTLAEKEKSRWKDSVNQMTDAYNSTPRHKENNSATGFCPYYLMFGQKPRLPIDLMFERHADESIKMEKFVENWQRALQETYQIARQNSTKSRESAKKRYDQRTQDLVLEEGDKVLVRNLTPRDGPGKLRNHWEDKVHIVTERKFDGPVYEVKPYDGHSRTRTLHRNLLLPSQLLEDIDTKDEIPSKKRVAKRARPILEDSLPESSDSEDEIESVLAFATRQPEGRNGNNNFNQHISNQLDPQDQAHTAAVTPDEEPTSTQDIDDSTSQELNASQQADEIDEADSPRPRNRTVEAPNQTQENPSSVANNNETRRPPRYRQPPVYFNYGQPGQPSYSIHPIYANPVFVNRPYWVFPYANYTLPQPNFAVTH